MTTMVVYSGGLDSTVALCQAMRGGDDVRALTFDYGQRHTIEIQHAARIANRLDVPWHRIDLSGVAALLPSSALTNPDVALPHLPYDGPTMDATVVPLRNALMLSVAAGAVASRGGGRVVTAVHAADHHLYPDCRPAFVAAMQETIKTSLDGVSVELVTPFIWMDKADIVRLGIELGAPLGDTWSCYEGGVAHCGTCGTCRERRRAFADAGVPDPTVYKGLVRAA